MDLYIKSLYFLLVLEKTKCGISTIVFLTVLDEENMDLQGLRFIFNDFREIGRLQILFF